jgi:hypothetical protein
MSEVVEHEETRTSKLATATRRYSRCSCGASWSHPESRSDEEMDAIFASHVKYFERTTVVL